VRVTYPLGAIGPKTPPILRATALGAGDGPGSSLTLRPVWSAPADAAIPGRSFFALLEHGDAAEGERLMVFAANGMPRSGVEIPASAIVMSAGRYWCYVERSPGNFARVEVQADEPTATGYFVASGLQSGDHVVIAAAGQLLAQESNSGGEPD